MERSWLRITIIIGAILIADAAKKRQIFREQVLPSRGGKIPEEAFRSDRLALNRLNKEGITVPDGVVLEARQVHKHPNPSGAMPEVLKVYLTPEGRYVPPEGRYHDDNPKAVDTTYLVRHPTEHHQHRGKLGGYNSNNKPGLYSGTGYRQFYHVTRPRIYKPLITPLIIPAGDDLLQKNYYHASWAPDRYSWDLIYEPFDDYFTNSLFLFNSHQILTDYEGFLNGFHDRSARHTPESRVSKNSVDKFTSKAQKSFSRQSSQSPKTFGYPDLAKIPETRFTCGQKRGIFADAETKCQVFHECGVNGKSSFLCPAGTVFSEVKKRCEWWDIVMCDNSSNRY